MPPYVPGHEVVGVVDAIGDQVSTVATGQRVTLEPDLPCWSCKMCATGRENLCENLRFFGCGYDEGGMAECFTIPANRLHVVPEGLDDQTAALIEPLSPIHAVRLAGDVRTKAVAILGAGTIGLMTLTVLRARGAGKIVVTDPRAPKRERAPALGADHAVDATAPDLADQVRAALGESADFVFDCVAIQSSVDQAVAIADTGGIVVIVGVPASAVTVALPILQDHQIRLQGTATYVPDDFTESIQLLQSGAVKAADFVTATRSLRDVAEAFELAASGEHVKVLVTVTAS